MRALAWLAEVRERGAWKPPTNPFSPDDAEVEKKKEVPGAIVQVCKRGSSTMQRCCVSRIAKHIVETNPPPW